MDTVFIEQLAARTIVGVRDWERQVEQTLYLDLELGTDITAAGRSDAVTDAVDYAAVARFAVDQVGAMRYQLVESVAEALVAALLDAFPVDRVRLRLSMPGAVPGARAVGVIIERGATAAPA